MEFKLTINNETKLYGSFSGSAGSFGASVFNTAFELLGINAIYKPFSVTCVPSAIKAMKTLNILGAGISMPFKEQVVPYANDITDAVKEIGAANTLVHSDKFITAWNTDYMAIEQILKEHSPKTIYILGAGGYAKAAFYAAKQLNIPYENITRNNWNTLDGIKDSFIFNATPVKGLVFDKSNTFIDCDTATSTGSRLALIQASYQFKLYTGKDLPLEQVAKRMGY